MLIRKGKKIALYISNNVVYKILLLEDAITVIGYHISDEENLMTKWSYTYLLDWVLEKCNVKSFEEFIEKFNKNILTRLEFLSYLEDQVCNEEHTVMPYKTKEIKCKKNVLSM